MGVIPIKMEVKGPCFNSMRLILTKMRQEKHKEETLEARSSSIRETDRQDKEERRNLRILK